MPDLAAALEGLKHERSTGCLHVESATRGAWQLYLLFGTVFHATGPGCEGDQAVAQALACQDATTRFDAKASLPEQQTVATGSSPRRPGPPGPTALVRRSCLVIALLVVVIVPAAGLGFAVWLLVTPTASEAAAAMGYARAPACPTSEPGRYCITIEPAKLVSLVRTTGRWGGHDDTLHLKLADGDHRVKIYFSTLARNATYAPPGAEVRTREYGGLVTTVYAGDGTAFETSDSPAEGSGSRRGTATIMIILLGAWLGVVAAFAIVFMVTNRARAGL